MTDQESNSSSKDPVLTDAGDPELYKDVAGALPIRKMLDHSKSGKKFHLKMKDVIVHGGEKYHHQIIEQLSKGGGDIEFVVGASRWKLHVTFKDLEFEEKKGFIVGV